jgi:hypothetical protein
MFCTTYFSIEREALQGFDGFMFIFAEIVENQASFTLGVRANVQPHI